MAVNSTVIRKRFSAVFEMPAADKIQSERKLIPSGIVSGGRGILNAHHCQGIRRQICLIHAFHGDPDRNAVLKQRGGGDTGAVI